MTSRSISAARTAIRERGEAEQTCLRVSFEFLDWETSEFFIHGFNSEFYERLFTCLQTIQSCTREQLSEQTHPSLRCKAIFKTETGTHCAFPARIVERLATKLGKNKGSSDPQTEAALVARLAFEVSMGKNQGRLHGFLWGHAFNLVWFDPAHNLYPGAHKVRGPKDLMLPKSGSHAELLRCKEENERLLTELEQLAKEHQELMTAWAAG